MKIGICDDSLRDRELLKTALMPALSAHDTLECFEHGAAFLEANDIKPFDVLFLDIGMPHLNGIEVARELRLTNRFTQIVFITQYRDYAAESYGVNAFSYLNKPVKSEHVREVFQKARDRRLAGGKYLTVKIDYNTVYVQISSIVYAEMLKGRLIIHSYDGTFDTRMSMRELAHRLNGDGFYRVHASYLINLSCIRSIHNKTVFLDGGVEIPVGKTKRVSDIKALVLSHRRRGL